MKRLYIIALLASIAMGVYAQPARRRMQQQQNTQQSNAQNITTRSRISFPTAQRCLKTLCGDVIYTVS